jgi:hypothetical protein
MASARPLNAPALRPGTRGGCPASGPCGLACSTWEASVRVTPEGVPVAQSRNGMRSVGVPTDDDPRVRHTVYRYDTVLPDSDRPW